MAQIFTGTDPKSLAVDIMARYTRVVDSEVVKITQVTPEQQAVLGLESLPCMIATEEGKTFKCTAPFAIFRHIAEAAKFEAIFLGKTEVQTNQILSYFELIVGLKEEELAELLNNDLKMRMYLVGFNITAADIFAYAHIVHFVQKMQDFEKIASNNLFRWVDLLQHLPGLNKYAENHNLFVTFPDEGAKQPSKSQLKKMAKMQAMKEHKEHKKQEKKDQKKQNKEAKEEVKEEVKEEAKAESNEEVKQEEATPEPDNSQSKSAEVEEDKKADASTEGGKKKKNKQQNPPKQKQQPKKEEYGEPITQLDIRVGRITKVWKHPDSEKLYCEEIDIGDEKPRQIASGLQQFIPIEQMENALVLVLANLKPKKLAGFESQGMVLTAGTPDHTVIELLVPPEGSQPGDKITIKGFERNPPPVLNPKKGIFEAVAGDLRVDENGIAKFKDAEFTTEKGIVVSTGIRDGKIS